MTGNSAIQFLRKKSAPTTEELRDSLPGQPLYDMANGHLYIGGKKIGPDVIDIRETFAWENIIELSRNGGLLDWFNLGDRVPLIIDNRYDLGAVLIGVNQDIKADGSEGYAGSTWVMDGILYDLEGFMNSTNSNLGGWRDCTMRTSTMPELLTKFPSILQSEIIEVEKRTYLDQASGFELVITKDKLFLLSEEEIYGGQREPTDPRIIHYDYYRKFATTAQSRIKRISGVRATRWWLRSVQPYGNTSFSIVSDLGTPSYLGANTGTSGLCGTIAAFCI